MSVQIFLVAHSIFWCPTLNWKISGGVRGSGGTLTFHCHFLTKKGWLSLLLIMPDLCNYAYLCHKNNNSWNIERETKEYLNSIVHEGWGPRIQFQHTTSISTPRWKIFSRFMGETYTVPFPLKNQKPFENWIFNSERKRYFSLNSTENYEL